MLVFLLCAAVYLHLATNEKQGFFTGSTPVSYYSQLAEGFRHGRLSLLTQPRRELLELNDPYDPIANAPYRLHDASLYKGKYYLYFGPTPALVLHLPSRLLSGNYPSDATAVLLFLTAGLAAWLAMFRLAIRAWLPRASLLWMILGGSAIGFCNTGPFLLARPAVYEVCLASSYCFTAISLLAFTKALTAGTARRYALVSGIALSLAIASRPPAVLIAPLLVAALLRRVPSAGTFWKTQVRRLIPFAVPLALTGMFLAAYNYLRFESPLEFGNGYQLAGINARRLHFFALNRIPIGFHYYFLSGHLISPEFPFIRTDPERSERLVEQVAGALPLYPFLLSLLIFPAISRPGGSVKPDLRLLIRVLIATGLASLLLVCSFVGITMRYGVEFGPPLVSAAVLTICAADVGSWRRRVTGVVFAPVLLAGAVQGFLLGFGGYYDSYARFHPGSIAAIQRRLLGLENGLARWFGGYGWVGIELEATTGTPGISQVLVSTGADATESWVVMRYLDPVTVQFGCAAPEGEGVYGQPIQLTQSTHSIEAFTGAMYPESRAIYASWFPTGTYDSIHERCLIRVDGATVADIKPYRFPPSAPWQVVVRRSEMPGSNRILSSRRVRSGPPF